MTNQGIRGFFLNFIICISIFFSGMIITTYITNYLTTTRYVVIFTILSILMIFILLIKRYLKYDSLLTTRSLLNGSNDVVYISNEGDVRLPYHFISVKQSIDNDKEFYLNDESRKYTPYYLTKNHINELYSIDYILSSNKAQWVSKISFPYLSSMKADNAIFNELKYKLDIREITNKDLIKYLKNLRSHLKLNKDELNQFKNDYFKAKNEIIKLREFESKQIINSQKNQINKHSHMYDELKNIIDKQTY